MKKIINILKFIHKNGIQGFIREGYYRINDNYYEKYFDVNTKGLISTEDLGISHNESIHYLPSHYRHIVAILNKLPVDKKNSTLLDYGCGKGRVIITAASYQYKKIIGVELSNLINVAKNNIDKMKHRNTINIELKQCDAIDFNVPPYVNIIYFFNPFIGSILENVTRNIYASYIETPRKIYIIYFNNCHFEKIIDHESWLTKIDQSELHLNISFGLYETNP
jgi:cyclopropane fatty-acyl-phospholipid synthase-like methyltransferase